MHCFGGDCARYRDVSVSQEGDVEKCFIESTQVGRVLWCILQTSFRLSLCDFFLEELIASGAVVLLQFLGGEFQSLCVAAL